MRNYLLLPLFFFFFLQKIHSQAPKPCGPTAAMTPTCGEACIICDLDGFKGINSSTLTGTAPSDFCTSFLHNAQWISFIAGSVDLTLEVSVTNCKQGNGLEIGLYEGVDCKNFKKISNCDTDIPNNTKQTFKNTKPLVIGQYYFFVMDGSDGDICNYTIKVLSGSTKVSPLTTSGNILGEKELCEGQKFTFENSGVAGAVDYNWSLDGNNISSKAQKITLDLLPPGTHEICCFPSNACDKGPQKCETITIKPIKRDTVNTGFCKGNCVKIADSLLCKKGTFTVKTKAKNGCDSIILVNLKEFEPKTTNFSFNFCEGDTLQFGNKIYTKAGAYQDKFLTQDGCDSTIFLALTEIKCNIKANDIVTNVDCNSSKTGEISFSIKNGTPPFNYNWQKTDNAQVAGFGSINGINENTTIEKLGVGTYFISITDNFNNIRIIQSIVNQPDSLKVNFKTSNFNGFNLACAGDANAFLTTTVSGGTPNYTYLWDNDAETPNIENLNAGIYTLSVTDNNNCVFSQFFQITEPIGVTYEAEFKNPDCSGFNTGKILLKNVKGGAIPYTYILNNQEFTDDKKLINLGAGIYEFKIKDANACESVLKVKDTLLAAQIPILDLERLHTIQLSEDVFLPVGVNIAYDSIFWEKKLGLSCYDCPNPLAAPVKPTLYKVAVVSKTGCITKDSVWVVVVKNHNLFIPNVFSPNGDGSNDRLMVFGGKSMAKIKSFQVFNRWGNLVYEGKDFAPNDPQYGWDGTYKGVFQDSNIFTWKAEIEFIDGEIEVVSGDSMLVK